MEEKRNFVVLAKTDDNGNIKTETALLTTQQLNVVFWLYNRGLLNGTYESDDDICIEEP